MHRDRNHIVDDLLTCAIEGGSNYWCSFIYETNPKDWTPKYRIEDNIENHIARCLLQGGTVRVGTHEDGSFPVDRKMLFRGLGIMRDKYPHHWASVLLENEDAETGDVFLQCATFGEIIYG